MILAIGVLVFILGAIIISLFFFDERINRMQGMFEMIHAENESIQKSMKKIEEKDRTTGALINNAYERIKRNQKSIEKLTNVFEKQWIEQINKQNHEVAQRRKQA